MTRNKTNLIVAFLACAGAKISMAFTSSSHAPYHVNQPEHVMAKHLTNTMATARRSKFVTATIKTMKPTTTILTSTASASEEEGWQEVDNGGRKILKFRKYAQIFCNLFPIWTLMTAGSALIHPPSFEWVDPKYFSQMIGLLMLCMGISLKPSDFQRVIQRPIAVLIAFLGCYGVMPGLAIILGKTLLQSEPALAAGLVLVSVINGAQASNLCTYIGQGDLALSVLMTTMTTVGAVVLTPLVGKMLLGTVVPVNAIAVAKSTAQVVLVPILLGMSINAKFPKTVQNILPFSPILGIILTCLLVGSSVAGSAGQILSAGIPLQLSAFLLHALGGLIGYVFTKPFYAEDICRTFAIEFAMKSSAFGYLLASLHFSEFAVRVPSAVSIVYMTLIGSCMAVASRFFPPEECIVENL